MAELKQMKNGTAAILNRNQHVLMVNIQAIGTGTVPGGELEAVKMGPDGYVYRNQVKMLATLAKVIGKETVDYEMEVKSYEMMRSGGAAMSTHNQKVLLANLCALSKDGPGDENCAVALKKMRMGPDEYVTTNQETLLAAIRAKDPEKFANLPEPPPQPQSCCSTM